MQKLGLERVYDSAKVLCSAEQLSAKVVQTLWTTALIHCGKPSLCHLFYVALWDYDGLLLVHIREVISIYVHYDKMSCIFSACYFPVLI